MTNGIHHITAIASDAKETLRFYTQILGLRLVKKTVNQDDVGTYHLFFGDTEGHPGMDLTFFIFLPPFQGRRGNGLVTTISLAVPEHSLDFWNERLTVKNVKHEEISKQFGRKGIVLYDKDDQKLSLVGIPENEMVGNNDVWSTADVAKDQAIRSFHSATLSVESYGLIEPVLTHVFEYKKIAQDLHSCLYSVTDSHRANILEVTESPSLEEGLNMAGTVHHIAFRAKDEAEQMEMRNKVLELGLYPTEVINRFYFKSVYFRTPAGILFEIATDGPGFTADESLEELGKKLALPPFLETHRKEIEAQIIPLET